MSSPFIGEIRLFAGNFAPLGWAFCDGSLQAIAENDALFSLIGTTYGGDGETTFALPDLRGRVPTHIGPQMVLGQSGGAEQVTLPSALAPSHTHVLSGSSQNAGSSAPTGQVPAVMSQVTTFAYGTDAPRTTMAPQTVGTVGGGQPHDNLQPYVCLNFIISLSGIYPSQS